jgi:hypothetical protein
MSDARPTWMLVIEAAKRQVQSHDSARARGTIQPVVQGMTANAGKGPPSPCGKVFLRIDHGFYKIRDLDEAVPTISSAPPRPSIPRGRARGLGRTEVRSRLDALIADFDECVEAYDRLVPFTRSGQYEFHRRTIDRRLALGSVEAAIFDEQFTELLYETLQRWGIGRRASRLAPLAEFRRTLAHNAASLLALEPVTLELLTEGLEAVSTSINLLVSNLAVVENQARIVAGTKTLHHLLPNLVPPMDRAWTGAFFGWSVLDPQNNQALILGEAFESFAEVARVAHPSRLVGARWRTSSTKVLDNALIGYCKLHGIGGTRT